MENENMKQEIGQIMKAFNFDREEQVWIACEDYVEAGDAADSTEAFNLLLEEAEEILEKKEENEQHDYDTDRAEELRQERI